jgi:hypothetical protein
MPARPGKRRACGDRLFLVQVSPLGQMQPFWAPFSRRMRVSLRVSMSAMPMTFSAFR